MKSKSRYFIVGCVAAVAAGNLDNWLAPQILFGAMHRYSVSAAQAGLLMLVEGAIMGLLSMVLSAFPPAMTCRKLALAGSMLLVLSNGLSLMASDFSMLVGTRFAAGLADAMLIFVGISTVAMNSERPDRSYALQNILSNVYGAFILTTFPLLFPQAHGLNYLPFGAVVTALILVPLLAFLPANMLPVRTAQSTAAAAKPADKKSFVMLLAIMIPLCFQTFMIFAYGPGLGARLGLSDATINTTQGAAMLVSVTGPFLAAAAAPRLGRWVSVVAMTAIFITFNIAITHTTNPLLFQLGSLINLTAVFFFIPLFLAWCADLDPTGRYSTTMMGGFAFISALTPMIVGAFIDRAGFDIIGPVVMVTGFIIAVLLIVLRFNGPRQSSTEQLVS